MGCLPCIVVEPIHARLGTYLLAIPPRQVSHFMESWTRGTWGRFHQFLDSCKWNTWMFSGLGKKVHHIVLQRNRTSDLALQPCTVKGLSYLPQPYIPTVAYHDVPQAVNNTSKKNQSWKMGHHYKKWGRKWKLWLKWESLMVLLMILKTS